MVPHTWKVTGIRRRIELLFISSLFIVDNSAPSVGVASPVPPKGSNYPNPEPCTGNCTWVHDPNVIYKDSTYYRFSTSGNIAIATAPRLTGPWKYQGALLDNGTSIFVTKGQDIWAPDVTLVDGTYYAYYAVSIFGSQLSQIGVATSKSLRPGTWTDHGSLNIPKSSDYNLIDPNLLYDPKQPSAPPYLVLGSYWDGIFQTPLTDLTTFDEGILTDIIRNSTTNSKVVEAGFQFAYGGFYYLFFSSGACCNVPPNLAPAGYEYSVMVCRSSRITGPFVDQDGKSCVKGNGGTEVLASHGNVYAPGGQGVMIENGSNKVVLYYHYVNPKIGYDATQFQFGFNYLDFETGWPKVVG
ncbi:glycoside hydrolase family 43 protein [Pleomassaria siparia CBS 279.74]|uniref:Arabinan endo-1,5-alpha-L-arabinosidase n=1 Tax=Pleomassaria siparia CBS 279.74 TaxID=1314801 RepID=A0A6G1KKX9_9PLEO|nr:glycoside hydrolase family 43 protein [Pleomassaria siparia CBS 279.74]